MKSPWLILVFWNLKSKTTDSRMRTSIPFVIVIYNAYSGLRCGVSSRAVPLENEISGQSLGKIKTHCGIAASPNLKNWNLHRKTEWWWWSILPPKLVPMKKIGTITLYAEVILSNRIHRFDVLRVDSYTFIYIYRLINIHAFSDSLCIICVRISFKWIFVRYEYDLKFRAIKVFSL